MVVVYSNKNSTNSSHHLHWHVSVLQTITTFIRHLRSQSAKNSFGLLSVHTTISKYTYHVINFLKIKLFDVHIYICLLWKHSHIMASFFFFEHHVVKTCSHKAGTPIQKHNDLIQWVFSNGKYIQDKKLHYKGYLI